MRPAGSTPLVDRFAMSFDSPLHPNKFESGNLSDESQINLSREAFESISRDAKSKCEYQTPIVKTQPIMVLREGIIGSVAASVLVGSLYKAARIPAGVIGATIGAFDGHNNYRGRQAICQNEQLRKMLDSHIRTQK